jgi:hypothetical protein
MGTINTPKRRALPTMMMLSMAKRMIKKYFLKQFNIRSNGMVTVLPIYCLVIRLEKKVLYLGKKETRLLSPEKKPACSYWKKNITMSLRNWVKHFFVVVLLQRYKGA